MALATGGRVAAPALRRMMRSTLAFLTLASFAAPLAAGADCAGDCDGDAEVTLGEVQLAFSAFFGTSSVDVCRAADGDRSDAIELGEVQVAFSRFLGSCDAPADVDALRGSAGTTLSSVRGVLGFGRLAAFASGSGGAAFSAAGAALLGGGAIGSADCHSGPCDDAGSVACACAPTATGAVLEVEFDRCAFSDGGSGFQIDGSFRLDSADPDLCTGSSAFGSDLRAEYSAFTLSVQGSDGILVVLGADLTESFEAAPLDCVPLAPDPLQYGVRGAGVRTLDGSLHSVQRDVFDGTTSLDLTTAPSELTTRVDLVPGEFDCRVEVSLSGETTITDAVADSKFTSSFGDLRIVETAEAGDSFLVDLDGRASPDCLGTLELFTSEPLRLASALDCPQAGTLQVRDPESGARAAILYGPNGVAFDLGADGTIEDRRASCAKLDLQQCGFAPPTGRCAGCSIDGDCAGDLICLPCVFCAGGVDSRCGPAGDLVSCGDDVYARRAPSP